MDEFPQLFNILAGDMTLVGTRPEVPKYVKKYTKEMYATLLLPAGLTSRTSIAYKDAAKAAVMKPFIDQAKAKNGTDSLTEDQQRLLERITHFDYTYHYSDDGAVWRHYSKVEGEINDSASAMGLFVGALSAMSRFISSYRPEK